MTKFDSWLKVGASWRVVSRDYQDIRPKEGFIVYKVTPAQDGTIQIEEQKRDPDGDDTNIVCIEDLASLGTLLDADPELEETFELDGCEHHMDRSEAVTLDSGPHDCYHLIRKKREECSRCGGSGDCPDCSASGECSNCSNSGVCQNCNGAGKCTDCDGSGRCNYCEGSSKCPSCEGTGHQQDQSPCSNCEGTGRCPTCNGNGVCPTCKGTARCTECIGSGKCGHCHGSGKCGFCNGGLKCRDCGGKTQVMTTSEYWFEKATGLMLKHVKTVNGRPILEEVVTAFSAMSQPQAQNPNHYQAGGALTMVPPPRTLPSPYGGPVPPQGAAPQTAVCPSCGGRLDFGRTVPMFCPNCGARLR